MDTLDLDRLRATPVAASPFPHVVVRDFVPPEALRAVAADLPTMQRRGSFPIGALRLGPAARAMLAELQGAAFREAIATKFGLDLAAAPMMATLRGRSNERDGNIHCDSAAKRVTILLYLNPQTAAWARQEGCLRLLRDPADIDHYEVEVPPVDGTLLAFPNRPGAWHGHKRFIGQRYVVQLNYMTNDERARTELLRHRVSAVVKRLLPAA